MEPQPRSPYRPLTPDERLAFDVRGFVVLPGVLDELQLKDYNLKLDHIEQIGLRCRAEFPDEPGVRHEDKYTRLGALQAPTDSEYSEAGISIGNMGQKIWAHGITRLEPSLAAVAAAPALRPYVEEFCDEPVAGLMSARYQWKGAESDIHDGRSRSTASRGPPPAGQPDPRGVSPMQPRLSSVEGVEWDFEEDDHGSHGGLDTRWQNYVKGFRIKTEPRAMVFMHDIEPGDGGLMVIPGSHKREVEWAPDGGKLTFYGNTRFEDITPAARALFVEVTGKAGTALLFNDDIIHQSWHTNDSYRRVIHLSWSHGTKGDGAKPSPCPAAHEAAPAGSWLRYLLRPRPIAEAPTEAPAAAKL
jgi:hypothetical protein